MWTAIKACLVSLVLSVFLPLTDSFISAATATLKTQPNCFRKTSVSAESAQVLHDAVPATLLSEVAREARDRPGDIISSVIFLL